MTPEERATVADEGLTAIEQRLAEAAQSDTAMHSACGEYECDCHRDMPDLIAEIRRLRHGWHEAVRKAIEDDRGLARARFHFNAQYPTTWEWEAIGDAQEKMQERCAQVARQYAATIVGQDKQIAGIEIEQLIRALE